MAKFMLILHDSPKNGFAGASPEEIQRIVEKYQSWIGKIRDAGKYVVSDKLKEEGGKVVTLQSGRLNVVDGPYSAAKEVVAGYFTIRAENYDEAIEMVRDCPHLAFGRVEIRQTDSLGCGSE
jgi:hypothetical protein